MRFLNLIVFFITCVGFYSQAIAQHVKGLEQNITVASIENDSTASIALNLTLQYNVVDQIRTVYGDVLIDNFFLNELFDHSTQQYGVFLDDPLNCSVKSVEHEFRANRVHTVNVGFACFNANYQYPETIFFELTLLNETEGLIVINHYGERLFAMLDLN